MNVSHWNSVIVGSDSGLYKSKIVGMVLNIWSLKKIYPKISYIRDIFHYRVIYLKTHLSVSKLFTLKKLLDERLSIILFSFSQYFHNLLLTIQSGEYSSLKPCRLLTIKFFIPSLFALLENGTSFVCVAIIFIF